MSSSFSLFHRMLMKEYVSWFCLFVPSRQYFISMFYFIWHSLRFLFWSLGLTHSLGVCVVFSFVPSFVLSFNNKTERTIHGQKKENATTTLNDNEKYRFLTSTTNWKSIIRFCAFFCCFTLMYDDAINWEIKKKDRFWLQKFQLIRLTGDKKKCCVFH